MAIEDYEEIAVGAVGGTFFPTLFQRYSPGKSETAVLSELPGPLKEKPVQAGVFAGLGGLALAALGSRGRGPFAGNESAINMSAAFGAASLGTATTFAMYPVEERAAAMGLVAKGEKLELSKPSEVSVEVKEEKEEEEEEAAPTGGAAGVGAR